MKQMRMCIAAPILMQWNIKNADWMEMLKHLHKTRTATIIEQTWRYHLHPLVGIHLADSIMEGLKLTHRELAALVHLAVDEQTKIGWDKLLVGLGMVTWKTIKELVDVHNLEVPERTGTMDEHHDASAD